MRVLRQCGDCGGDVFGGRGLAVDQLPATIGRRRSAAAFSAIGRPAGITVVF